VAAWVIPGRDLPGSIGEAFDNSLMNSRDNAALALVHFAIWHRLFVDQPAAKPTPNENLLDWIS